MSDLLTDEEIKALPSAELAERVAVMARLTNSRVLAEAARRLRLDAREAEAVAHIEEKREADEE